MFSRIIVIVLAFGAAAYRASGGAWVEAAGLVGLGGGLLALRLAAGRLSFRRLAYLLFAVTAFSIAWVIVRDYL